MILVKSKGEEWVMQNFASLGCEVLKNGWPDLLVVSPEGKLIFVEVKTNGDKISNEQKRVHEVLSENGMPVKVVRVLHHVLAGEDYFLLDEEEEYPGQFSEQCARTMAEALSETISW